VAIENEDGAVNNCLRKIKLLFQYSIAYTMEVISLQHLKGRIFKTIPTFMEATEHRWECDEL
jgi:hypothetical protein